MSTHDRLHTDPTQTDTPQGGQPGDDRCESVNPATGRRCTNQASRNGLCSMCRHAVTVVRVDDVPFDPSENPTPFSDLDHPPQGGDSA